MTEREELERQRIEQDIGTKETQKLEGKRSERNREARETKE